MTSPALMRDLGRSLAAAIIEIDSERINAILIQYGKIKPSRINIRTDSSQKTSLLHFAALNGLTEVVKCIAILKRQSEPINPPDKEGQTPLHIASAKGHREIVHLILRSMQEEDEPNPPNKDGMTPLHLAVLRGDELIVIKLLIAICIRRGNPNPASPITGETPLHFSVRQHTRKITTAICAALRMLKISPLVREKMRNQTPLDYAASCLSTESATDILSAVHRVPLAERANLGHKALLDSIKYDNEPLAIKIYKKFFSQANQLLQKDLLSLAEEHKMPKLMHRIQVVRQTDINT